MPPLISCSICGTTIPADAPAGMCPLCLMRLVLGETPRPEETPVSLVGVTPEPLDSQEAALRPTVRATADSCAPTTRGGTLPPPPPNIRRLGNYELIEELGKGGMGVVYKALQLGAKRFVAVKLLLGGAASDRSLRERFQAEVQTLAQLRHPNIVPVFEVGEQDGCPFFSMEYVSGGTLAARARASPLPPAEAAAIIEKLALVVETVHRVGVLHRDIKPSNVLLDADGTPRLTDFGLAKRLDRHDSLTNTDSVVGTPSYMAPEQASGSKELTAAADVYGLGATLYTLLTGHPPFLGRNPVETMHRVLHEDPVPPRTRRPDVPPDLEAVCLKCLEKDPEGRYASAQALADDLARWREGTSTIARPLRWPRRAWRWVARKWKPLAVTAAMIVAVALTPPVIAWLTDPKARLERRVASSVRRGEPFALIGPTSPPSYYEWVIGVGTTEDQQGVPFKMVGARTGMIQLLADSHTDRYRITVEYFVETSTRPDCWAGFYFAHQRGARGPNGAIDRAIVVRFRDDLINNKPGWKEGDPVNVSDALFIRGQVVLEGKEVTHQFELSPIARLWVQEPKGRYPGPLRKIVAEVTPESVRVLWWDAATDKLVPVCPEVPVRDSATGKVVPVPIDPIPARTFHDKTDVQTERVKKLAPTIDPGRLEFHPRGGLGLYSHNAGVIFKNVTLEPLP